MHVTALSTLRSASRPYLYRSACRIVAGSRIPPYKVSRRRSFGSSSIRRKAAAASGVEENNGESPAEVDKSAQENEVIEEEIKRNGSGRGGRVVVGGRSRVRGARERTGVPELELSKDFLEDAVILTDGEDTDPVGLKKMPWKGADGAGNNNVATEGSSTLQDSETIEDHDWQQPVETLFEINEVIYNEALNRVRANLLLRPPNTAANVARPITFLHCPHEGADSYLNAVIREVSKDLEADLILVDADDIAEQMGGYLGENIAWQSSPVSELVYEIHQTVSSSNEHSSESLAAGPTNISKMLMGVIGPPKSSLEEDDYEVANSSSEKKVTLNSIFNLAPSKSNPTEPDQWTTLKMNAGLEKLVQGADEKRKKQDKVPKDQETTTSGRRRLIVVLQGYLEIKSTETGRSILDKLRTIIDKKWRDGQEIVLLGTTTLVRSRTRHTTASGPHGPWIGMPSFSTDCLYVPAYKENAFTHGLFRMGKNALTTDCNIRHVESMVKAMLNNPKSSVVVNIKKEVDEIAKLMMTKTKHGETYVAPEISEANSLKSMGLNEAFMSSFRTEFHKRIFSKTETQRLASMMVGQALESGADRIGARELYKAVKVKRDIDTIKFNVPPIDDDATIISTVFLGDTAQTVPESYEDRLAHLRQNWSRQEEKLSTGIVAPTDIKTTFADIRAPEETVEALKTLTSLSLLRPEAFSYGVLATDKIPGLLLYGPPGTGKTLLAKAVAKESGATVLDVSGADLNDKYVGEGEKNVKALFSLAKKLSPCIVFIDEADAIFAARGGQSGSQQAHRDLINQFLREWDGMKDMGTFIMIATNRPFDLDDAVLRRLPRRLLVDLPLENDREAILKIHLKDEVLEDGVVMADIARETPLYSGSDLKNVCVAAALACIRDENAAAATWTGEGKYEYPAKRTLTKEHFKKALDEISASVSEDMSTLTQIRKFDERYGDRKGRRKKKASFGFGKVEEGSREGEEGRVRTATPS